MESTNRIGLSSSTLKIVAIVTMLIDHTGAVLFPENLILRIIGRLAFPIFCFLIVEGYFHTRNVYSYGIRLLLFAIISEIPFDLAFHETVLELSYQNVFFTLFIGLVMIYFAQRVINPTYKALICIAAMFVAFILRTDYSYFGIIMIFIFYLFRNKRAAVAIIQIIINAIMGYIQIFAGFAIIPILLYNGNKGSVKMKYFFYLFYPVHLLVLVIFRDLLLH